MTYQALHLSPMIPSFDLKKTGQFFKEILEFETAMETETYAIYYKDQHSVHILRAGENIGQMEFYLEINDVDGLWETIKDQIVKLHVRPPFDQEYGMREIHIAVPETNALMFIGQMIKVK